MVRGYRLLCKSMLNPGEVGVRIPDPTRGTEGGHLGLWFHGYRGVSSGWREGGRARIGRRAAGGKRSSGQSYQHSLYSGPAGEELQRKKRRASTSGGSAQRWPDPASLIASTAFHRFFAVFQRS